MSLLNVSAAARSVGKSRVTLHRYLKDGRLSSVTDDTGNIKIDTSELLRVFGGILNNGAVHATTDETLELQQETGDYVSLRQQLQASQEREEWLKGQLEAEQERSRLLELEREREREHSRELERRVLALPEGGAGREKKKGIFTRLFGIDDAGGV